MRFFELVPAWAAAARSGEVGVAQTRLMSRVAAKPRLHVALVECVDRLLADAIVLPFEEFERRVRDLSGPRIRTAPRQRPDGSWWSWAKFGSLQGAQVNDVFAHFVQAEWASDWAEARERCGDEAGMADLRRSEPRRRADAMAAVSGAAAGAPGDGKAAVPTLNIVLDDVTAEAIVTGEVDPSSAVVVATDRSRK